MFKNMFYTTRVFGAESGDYALLRSVLKGLQAFALLVLVPLVARGLKMHDTLWVALCTAM